MCEAYNTTHINLIICLCQQILYGPNDNYDRKTSHFFPALI